MCPSETRTLRCETFPPAGGCLGLIAVPFRDPQLDPGMTEHHHQQMPVLLSFAHPGETTTGE
jgi:hypothetical protein